MYRADTIIVPKSLHHGSGHNDTLSVLPSLFPCYIILVDIDLSGALIGSVSETLLLAINEILFSRGEHSC